ncbi:MAG: hypothetical protein WCG87_02440 [Bacteroidota bacterium]
MNDHQKLQQKQLLQPQNFIVAMAVTMVYIILPFTRSYLDQNYRFILTGITILTGVIVLWQLKKYLFNFSSNKAMYWINRTIIMSIILAVIDPISNRRFFHLINNIQPILSLSFFLIVMAIWYLTIYASVRLGSALRNIENDTIGLIHLLGNSLLYLIPSAILITIGVSGIILKNNTLKTSLSPLLGISHILFLIPKVIMFLIFLRAKKYQGQQIVEPDIA